MKSERERPEIMWREIQEMSSGPMGLWGLEAVELGLAVRLAVSLAKQRGVLIGRGIDSGGKEWHGSGIWRKGATAALPYVRVPRVPLPKP